MQLKLLNFYKFLSNFANSLVGAFVPLIIFSVTGELYIAFIYLLMQESIRFTTTFLLKKKMQRNPQIFLLFRIGTLMLYNVFIILLDVNLWVGVCGVCLFYGMDQSFKYCANELIYNYSSLNRGGKSLGITRVFEQLGAIASIIVGGVLLDIDRVLVVIISLSLYAISLVPLLIYYFKSRKNKLFNKDAISNAMEKFNKDEEHSAYNKKIVKKILFGYALVYFVFCVIDYFPSLYQLQLFFDGSDKFTMAGVFSAIFNAGFGVGSFIAGKQNDKIDLTRSVQIACGTIGVCMAMLAFVQNEIIIYILFAMTGFVYPYISVFVYQRLLVKSRILGASNWAILYREEASVVSYIFIFGISLILSILPKVVLFAIFLVIAAAFIFCIYLIPKNEEKTRKLLVDFLEDNEIKNDERPKQQENSQLKAEK